MKILLVEDHSIVRYGVIRILQGMSHDISIDESADFDEALRHIGKKKYDLIILDINIPHGNDLEMIRLIRVRQPDIKILIFSGADERMYALRYLREGADGYLMKDSPNKEIIDAVRTVMNNEKYCSAYIRQQLLQKLSTGEQVHNNPMMALSDREIQVMQYLIQGQSISAIARLMNLHISTVSTYKTRLFQKFEVTNVIELAEKRRML